VLASLDQNVNASAYMWTVFHSTKHISFWWQWSTMVYLAI